MPQIYVSIGTNIQRKQHLQLALSKLHQFFGALTLSSVYQSEAIGFEGDDFYNLVAGFKCHQSIEEINATLKRIEKMSGRDHSAPKFSARTLDIDLLNYGDEVCEQPVVLPREEILFNAFVLLPLAELAPSWIHPEKKLSAEQIWQAFDKSSQRLEKISWPIDIKDYLV